MEIRNPPRAGKKLLVLDVDYTIFGVYISFNFFISLNKSYTFHQWKLSSVMIQLLNNQFADFKNDTYCISQLVHYGNHWSIKILFELKSSPSI